MVNDENPYINLRKTFVQNDILHNIKPKKH